MSLVNEGYDVVSGWRRDRQDRTISRVIPSMMANRLISWISGVRLSDYGCTLKAYRREVLEDVQLYGEMHRFVPIYASWNGARVTEIVVQHNPRTYGVSKYGLERIVKVVLDLIVHGGVGLIAHRRKDGHDWYEWGITFRHTIPRW